MDNAILAQFMTGSRYWFDPGCAVVQRGIGEDAEFVFGLTPGLIEKRRYGNPFTLRDRLFALEKAEDAKALFEEFGGFMDEQIEQPILRSIPKAISFRELATFREMVGRLAVAQTYDEYDRTGHTILQEAMQSASLAEKEHPELLPQAQRAVGWAMAMLRAPAFSVVVENGIPLARIDCYDFPAAMRATMMLSRLRGFQFGRCENIYCRKLFKIVSGHDRSYCSPACRRRQGVRNWRKEHPYQGKRKTK